MNAILFDVKEPGEQIPVSTFPYGMQFLTKGAE